MSASRLRFVSRRPGREAALVLAGFAALWTWPLALRPGTTMAGALPSEKTD